MRKGRATLTSHNTPVLHQEPVLNEANLNNLKAPLDIPVPDPVKEKEKEERKKQQEASQEEPGGAGRRGLTWRKTRPYV